MKDRVRLSSFILLVTFIFSFYSYGAFALDQQNEKISSSIWEIKNPLPSKDDFSMHLSDRQGTAFFVGPNHLFMNLRTLIQITRFSMLSDDRHKKIVLSQGEKSLDIDLKSAKVFSVFDEFVILTTKESVESYLEISEKNFHPLEKLSIFTYGTFFPKDKERKSKVKLSGKLIEAIKRDKNMHGYNKKELRETIKYGELIFDKDKERLIRLIENVSFTPIHRLKGTKIFLEGEKDSLIEIIEDLELISRDRKNKLIEMVQNNAFTKEKGNQMIRMIEEKITISEEEKNKLREIVTNGNSFKEDLIEISKVGSLQKKGGAISSFSVKYDRMFSGNTSASPVINKKNQIVGVLFNVDKSKKIAEIVKINKESLSANSNSMEKSEIKELIALAIKEDILAQELLVSYYDIVDSVKSRELSFENTQKKVDETMRVAETCRSSFSY